MMTRKKLPGMATLRTLVCLLLSLVVVVGCDDRSSSSPGGPKVFRFINRGDIITLDTNSMSYLQDFRIAYALREGLFTYDPDQNFKPLPALAEEAIRSEDGKTWTFKLRKDGRWQNGDPVTARDFIFSWKLMLQSPGEYTSLFYVIENAKAFEDAYREGKAFDESTLGFQALDDYTIQLKLRNPIPYVPDLLAFPPFYPRHEASMEPFKTTDAAGRVSYSADYTRPENVITNGPFRFTQWLQGEKLVMVKSDTYRAKDEVKLDVIENIVNPDPQSAFVQYENGKVDWLSDVAPEIAAEALEAGRKDLRIATAYGTAFLTVNCAEKVPGQLGDARNPLSDVRVRQALAMSINKTYIVETITRMNEQPARSYVPPGFFEGWSTKETPAYDLEAARKLLAEAGYPGGRGMPTITIAYNSDNPTRKRLAEFLRFDWRDKLGVPVEVRPLELKTYRNEVTTKNYTLGLAAWYGDYMDPSTFTEKYRSTSENNDSNWAPPAYDRLIDEADTIVDAARRQQMLADAVSMINTELPIIPLYHYVNVSMHRDDVIGNLSNPKNLVVWSRIDLRR